MGCTGIICLNQINRGLNLLQAMTIWHFFYFIFIGNVSENVSGFPKKFFPPCYLIKSIVTFGSRRLKKSIKNTNFFYYWIFISFFKYQVCTNCSSPSLLLLLNFNFFFPKLVGLSTMSTNNLSSIFFISFKLFYLNVFFLLILRCSIFLVILLCLSVFLLYKTAKKANKMFWSFLDEKRRLFSWMNERNGMINWSDEFGYGWIYILFTYSLLRIFLCFFFLVFWQNYYPVN